jgi:16S rRNA (guanine527-N7)-methyltransferase
VKQRAWGIAKVERIETWTSVSLPKLSSKTVRSLIIFTSCLRDWVGYHGMTSKGDAQFLWERHIVDSLQIMRFAPDALRWLDIGSGSGFPAAVIASFLAHTPRAEVICVESDRRKCAFLTAAAREARLPLTIYPHKIQTLQSSIISPIHAVTSRATSGLKALITLADPYLWNGAIGIFPVGNSQPTRTDKYLARHSYMYSASLTKHASKIFVIQRNQ